MVRRKRRLKLIGLLAGTAIWMGADCASFPPFGPVPVADTVVIELANYTEFSVEPWLFVDPVVGVAIEQLLVEENWVEVDPPLEPSELATYEFYCEDVGTLASDHAWMYISDTEYYESDDAPVLDQGIDFACGDTVTLNFIDDGQVFYTLVEVNGQPLPD